MIIFNIIMITNVIQIIILPDCKNNQLITDTESPSIL